MSWARALGVPFNYGKFKELAPQIYEFRYTYEQHLSRSFHSETETKLFPRLTDRLVNNAAAFVFGRKRGNLHRHQEILSFPTDMHLPTTSKITTPGILDVERLLPLKEGKNSRISHLWDSYGVLWFNQFFSPLCNGHRTSRIVLRIAF